MVEVAVDSSRRCPVATFANSGGTRPPLRGLEEFDELRKHGSVFEVEEGNGFVFQQGRAFLMVTGYEDILEVAQNSRVFSNDVNKDIEGASALIPEELDGDVHVKWRRLLAPVFSPGQVKKLDESMRLRANELIDGVIERGQCDFIREFSLQFPTSIFLTMMGLPQDKLNQYIDWVQAILHPDPADLANAFATQQKVTSYFSTVIAEKRAAREKGDTDDGLISKSLEWQIDGEYVSDEDLLSFCLLLFQAGLDTVTATLGYNFYHLATHPEDRERIVNDPDVIPHAIEELLRVYGLVAPPRIAIEDSMIGSCPVYKGDRIALAFASAGRDETVFPDSLKVDFDRERITHFGFGAGPHRCLGSNLARHEMIVAIEEWHKRIPEYWLTPSATIDEDVSEIFGLNSLPLSWKS